MNAAIARPGPRSALSRGRRGLERYGWRALSGEVVMRCARPALAPIAARKLQRRALDVHTVEDVLDVAFGFEAFGIRIRPCQSRWELQRLLERVAPVRPRAMLEIGTANGGSLFAFARLCSGDARIISLDLPKGAFGGGYPVWKLPLYRSFAGPDQRLHLIRGDSHSADAFAQVEAALAGRMLDLLFIDGDHTFAGVQADFERYKTLVRPGGLIAFHDIAPPRPDSPVGDDPGDVPRFWEHLTAQHDGEAFIDPRGRGCFGIGLLTA